MPNPYAKSNAMCIFFDTIWQLMAGFIFKSQATPAVYYRTLVQKIWTLSQRAAIKSRYLSISAEVLSQFAMIIKEDI